VANPVDTLRDTLTFIGTDARMPDEFSLRANEFVATPRIPTHSVSQAPITTRGRYKYRAYEAVMPNLFSEVKTIIEPWIAELGYESVPA
jgi:hypothetical protein